MPISSIRIDVDQPTFQSWSRAMINLSRSFSIPLVPVPPLGGLFPVLPSHLTFTGVDLLNEVGRAATRPEITDDPERLFALFRYGTKIGTNIPNLRLRDRSYIRDFHKKAVLSDELGSGFALLAAGRLLGVSIFLDLHNALRQRLVSTKAPRSTVPDYVGLYGPGGSTVILEAKGSQSRYYCRKIQVPKGCRQVRSVSTPPAATCLRVVIGTALRKDSDDQDSRTFFGDPEEDERPYLYEFGGTLESVAVRENYMRIATLVGDESLFTRVTEPTARAEERHINLVQRTIENRAAIGSTFEVRSGSSITGFFVGIDLDARKQLLDFLSTQKAGAQGATIGVEPIGKRERDQDWLSHYSVTRDGTILQLWSEGPLLEEIVKEQETSF